MPRLIIVSNRLPTTLSCALDGTFRSEPASGGLVSGLKGYLDGRTYLWVGSSDIKFESKKIKTVSERQEHQVRELLSKEGRVPVFVAPDQYKLFYEGYANNVLWPFLHSRTDLVHYSDAGWQAYCLVNRAFAQVTASIVEQGDTVWIQDYQLFMMCGMLSDILAKTHVTIKLGFFLHIPMPKAALFDDRHIPHWQEWVVSTLSCTLVGFQTNIETKRFGKVCVQGLGAQPSNQEVDETTGNISLDLTLKKETTRIGTYNIGITPDQFEQIVQGGNDHDRFRKAYAELDHEYRKAQGFQHIVCGVERLDYSKGIPERIIAFGELLDRQDRFRPGKTSATVLIQVCVPSRGNIPAYQVEYAKVVEATDAVNKRYPGAVVVIHKPVPFAWMCALYRISTACLVTPAKDGMNLVAFEYVATQSDNHGTLVLSVEPGAAHYLDGYIPCDPHATADDLPASGVFHRKIGQEYMVQARKRSSVTFNIDELHKAPPHSVDGSFEVKKRQPLKARVPKRKNKAKKAEQYPSIALALCTALTMDPETRAQNWQKGIAAVRKHTAFAWATRFLDDLQKL